MGEFGESTLQREPNPERANLQSQAPGNGTPTSAPGRSGGGAATATHRGVVRSVHYNLSYIVQNEERGGRGAIVLLHDLPGGAFTWEPVLPQLGATGRAVYVFDMLGYGQSDTPWPADVSIWGHADTLTYAFEALRLTDIVLAGVGVGAGVAQVLATRLYRPNVTKLALFDSYGYSYAFAPNWPLPDMAARQDPEAPRHTPLEQMLEDLRTTFLQGSANPQAISTDRLRAYLQEWNSELGKEVFFQHIRQLLPNYQNSISSDLKQLETPVLLAWGTNDTVTPPNIGERMAREIPHSRWETFAGAGHLVLEDAPQAVGTLLADFAGQR